MFDSAELGQVLAKLFLRPQSRSLVIHYTISYPFGLVSVPLRHSFQESRLTVGQAYEFLFKIDHPSNQFAGRRGRIPDQIHNVPGQSGINR